MRECSVVSWRKSPQLSKVRCKTNNRRVSSPLCLGALRRFPYLRTKVFQQIVSSILSRRTLILLSRKWRRSQPVAFVESYKKLWRTGATLCPCQIGNNLNLYGITAVHEAAHAVGYGGAYKDDTDPKFDNLPPNQVMHPRQAAWGIPGAD